MIKIYAFEHISANQPPPVPIIVEKNEIEYRVAMFSLVCSSAPIKKRYLCTRLNYQPIAHPAVDNGTPTSETDKEAEILPR